MWTSRRSFLVWISRKNDLVCSVDYWLTLWSDLGPMKISNLSEFSFFLLCGYFRQQWSLNLLKTCISLLQFKNSDTQSKKHASIMIRYIIINLLDIVILYSILSPNLSEDPTYNLNQSNRTIFCRNRQADTKIYVEKPKQF